MSRQVLKRQLEAFTAANLGKEESGSSNSTAGNLTNDQGKKLKRKKRQLTLAEQIKKEKEQQSKQNHTADNMRLLLFSSSNVARAVKRKSTKAKTEEDKYEKYGNTKLGKYLGSLKRLKGVKPEDRQKAKAMKLEAEKKLSVDTLYDAIVSGNVEDDDLLSGTGLKGRSKDGYQYGNSTKRIKSIH